VAVGAGKMMMHLFKVEFAIMMLQGICLKVEFVESVIQILKKVKKPQEISISIENLLRSVTTRK
jgi:hypothetical protein